MTANTCLKPVLVISIFVGIKNGKPKLGVLLSSGDSFGYLANYFVHISSKGLL